MLIDNYKENRTYRLFYSFHEHVVLTTKLILRTIRTLQDRSLARWVNHYIVNLDVYSLVNIPFKAVNLTKEVQVFHHMKVNRLGDSSDLQRHAISIAIISTSLVRTLGKGLYALGQKEFIPVYRPLRIFNLPGAVLYDALCAIQTIGNITRFKKLQKEAPTLSKPLDQKKLTDLRTFLKERVHKKNLKLNEKRTQYNSLKDRTILLQELYLREATHNDVIKQLRKCRQLSKQEFFDKQNQKKISNSFDNIHSLLRRRILANYFSASTSVLQGVAFVNLIYSLAPPSHIAVALWTTYVVETFVGIYELFYVNKNLKKLDS